MWTGLPRQISDSLTHFSCVCVLDCFQFQNTNQMISFSKSIMTKVHEYRIIWSDWVRFSNSRKGPVFTWLDFTAVLIGLVGQGSRWLLFIRPLCCGCKAWMQLRFQLPPIMSVITSSVKSNSPAASFQAFIMQREWERPKVDPLWIIFSPLSVSAFLTRVVIRTVPPES